MNKCTCGTKRNVHSIFCSIDFYIDPLSSGQYKPKTLDEKSCKKCFTLIKNSQYKKNSDICNDCS